MLREFISIDYNVCIYKNSSHIVIMEIGHAIYLITQHAHGHHMLVIVLIISAQYCHNF